MELRHLRYFVAVAESRSLKLAAEKRLHTTQPSLSRQIRDLETEVGTPLFSRGARGVELTPAGRVFLDHARVVLSQAETALQSARQVVNPMKPSFALGFMIGHESTWLPAAVQLLRDELPHIHLVISTQNSPQLAAALLQGRVDVAFLRREDGGAELEYSLLIEESLQVFLPSDHRLAACEAIRVEQMVGETFLSVSGAARRDGPPARRHDTEDRRIARLPQVQQVSDSQDFPVEGERPHRPSVEPVIRHGRLNGVGHQALARSHPCIRRERQIPYIAMSYQLM